MFAQNFIKLSAGVHELVKTIFCSIWQ